MNQTPTRFRRIGATFATIALVAVGLVAFPMSASAATIDVTSLLDDNSGGTLREAIVQANGTAGADAIRITVPGTITLTSTITVTAGINVLGATTGAGTTITRNFSGDIFVVDLDVIALGRDFTLLDIDMNGNTPATTGRAVSVTGAVPANYVGLLNSYFFGFKGAPYGGAVSVFNTTGGFTADNTDFTNNQSSGLGGSVYVEDVAGAIQFSSMNMQATQGTTGGGIYIDSPASAVTLIGSEIAAGTATTDAGGGMFVLRAATLNVQDSTLGSNTSLNAGGGLSVSNVASTTITDSAITDNAVTGNRGGGLYVNGGTLAITSSTFSFNTSTLGGGGIYADVTWFRMDDSSVQDNTSVLGGGIEFNGITDTSYITNSNFTNNRARSAVAPGGLGGAISFVTVTGAPFTITATTFENNEAVTLTGNNVSGPGRGGAIYAVGTGDSFVIEDSLFTNNSLGAYPGNYGVSIYVDASDVADLFNIVNTTFDEPAESMAIYVQGFVGADGEFVVAHTTFVTDLAIAILDTSGPIVPRVTHTIFDGGAGFQTIITDAGPDVQVEWSLFGASLVDQNVTASNSTFDVPSMKLGALQNNGGPTLTRLPLPGSPAIDRGNPAAIDLPAYDQREADFARVINNIVDIGAVEAPRTLAPTGATVNPVIPIGGGILLLLGIGAVILASRRKRTKSH